MSLAKYILRIPSWPLYFSCNQEFSAKGGKEIFLIYLDTILDTSLNILLTDNETDCLFSLYMSRKQFGMHINYSSAKPRNKWALWIYSTFFSLKVCSLDLSFHYLFIHSFAPNCSDHFISLIKLEEFLIELGIIFLAVRLDVAKMFLQLINTLKKIYPYQSHVLMVKILTNFCVIYAAI